VLATIAMFVASNLTSPRALIRVVASPSKSGAGTSLVEAGD
jgi:hypothetical protein